IGMLPRTCFGDPIHSGWPLASSGAVSGGSMSAPLVGAIAVSAARLLAGFTLAALLGAAIGVILWSWRTADELLGPPLLGLQTLPSVCWIPLAILLPGLGMNEKGVLFVLVMGSVFGIAASMRDGLRIIPPVYRS